jgi:hypothetical protein
LPQQKRNIKSPAEVLTTYSADQVRVLYQRNEESNRRQSSSSRKKTGFVAAAGATNCEEDSAGDRRRRMGEGSGECGEWRSDRRFCRGRQQLQVDGEGEATGVCGRKRDGWARGVGSAESGGVIPEVNVHLTFLNEKLW